METQNHKDPRRLPAGQKEITDSWGFLQNIPLRIFLVTVAFVGLSACSSSIDAPAQPKTGITLGHMIMCDANNNCSSDGGDDGVGPQTLSLFVHTGCVHDSYQHVAATCPTAPWAGNISGGSPGSSYNISWYQSHCNSPDAEIGPNYCEPFDTLSGHLVFTNSDYEIDLMAQIQEVGGNGLTGVGVVQMMGPASVDIGTQVGCTGYNASDDIIYKFPNRQVAHNPDGTLMTNANGQTLFKDFARNPCTNAVVYSSAAPHPFP